MQELQDRPVGSSSKTSGSVTTPATGSLARSHERAIGGVAMAAGMPVRKKLSTIRESSHASSASAGSNARSGTALSSNTKTSAASASQESSLTQKLSEYNPIEFVGISSRRAHPLVRPVRYVHDM